MSVLLLDASVWLASIDPTDGSHPSSAAIIDSAATRPIAALDLTLYEVANVTVAGWRQEAEAARVVKLVERASRGRIERIDGSLVLEASRLAAAAGLSVYDAAYVACARRNGWTLVSADMRDLVRPGFAVTPEDALSSEP